MFNTILIADTAASEAEMKVYNASGTEIQVNKSSGNNSEMEIFAVKSLTAFGAMLVCILIFLVIVFIYKKKIQTKAAAANKVHQQKHNIKNTRVKNVNSQPKLKEKNIQTLSTPLSVNKCIKHFLENTKNI